MSTWNGTVLWRNHELEKGRREHRLDAPPPVLSLPEGHARDEGILSGAVSKTARRATASGSKSLPLRQSPCNTAYSVDTEEKEVLIV